MILRLIGSKKEIAAWNKYVYNHSQATPYHSYAWLQSVQTAYKHQTTALIAEEGNLIVGVLPIVTMRMPIVGDLTISLPYCDLGGVLADDEAVTKPLLTHGLGLCNDKKIKKFEIRQQSPVAITEESSLSGKKVRMLLSLPGSSVLLASSFKAKLRSQINKSKKNGLTASLALGHENPALVDDFYRVYCINMRLLGSPVHSKEWFVQIAQNYGKYCIVCIVSLEGQAVAGGIVLRTSRSASIPWASTIPDYNRLAPNMLLYWSLLEFCADHDIQEFDFGRSTYDEGTYRFKKQWGAKPELLQWDKYHNGEIREQEHGLSRLITLRSLVESGWRNLPLPVTTWIGPRIRKYINL